jgi:SM-20-related protein
MNPVTVILQGGYALELDPADEDPVIQSLISGEIFAAAPDRALEIPTAGGERLRFRAAAIVAVIMPGAEGESAGIAETPPGGANVPPKAAIVYRRAVPGAVEPYVLIENFLPAAEHDEVLRRTLAARERFVASKVDDKELHYRASLVLNDEVPIVELMRPRIAAALPAAAVTLGLAEGLVRVEPSAVECQVTAHNDGDYYRVHNDAGSPRTKHRTLSYVYYFQSRPKSFQGGELRLYEVAVKDGFYVAGESYWLIEPKDNALLFFPSHAMHEILPVTCSSRAFEDSRFTVNGWVAL